MTDNQLNEAISRDEPAPRCPSCGIAWHKHRGCITLCGENKQLRQQLADANAACERAVKEMEEHARALGQLETSRHPAPYLLVEDCIRFAAEQLCKHFHKENDTAACAPCRARQWMKEHEVTT